MGEGGSDTASFATAMPNDEWTSPLVSVDLAAGYARSGPAAPTP